MLAHSGRGGRWSAVLLAGLLVQGAGARAQVPGSEGWVPPSRQAAILLKVLSFDYSLSKRTSGPLRLAIAYSPKSPRSGGVAREMQAAFQPLAKMTIQGRAIETSLLPVASAAQLKAAIVRGVNAVYFCPGLEDLLPGMLAETRARQASTLTGLRGHLESGVAIGVVLQGSSPKIGVSLAGLRAHGQKLSSDVLGLALIIR